ncbi:hypothetical protein [Nocardia nova]|uniref:Uncharacterized protein n=1 Tax=Nocardia nova TaxID=37330 RepID=A0A2S6A1Y9_9NOCA|nr:hypothetical protein [Nocardia nova]PPJ25578.1 hypothetical protein C5F51_22345 [Nocardia nova]
MLTPTPGDLLAGIHRELKDQVLPELPPSGAAARQLRAALHTLDQVARTWDLQHSYIAADNLDLDATLTELVRLSGAPRQRAEHSFKGPTGATDETLRELLDRNLELQAELVAFQQDHPAAGEPDEDIDRVLAALHHRLVERAAIAAGVPNDR